MKKSLVLLTAAIALMTMSPIVQADAGTFQAAGTFTINGVPTAPPPTRIVVQGPKTVKLDPEDRARLDRLAASMDTTGLILTRMEQTQRAQAAQPNLGRDIVAAVKQNGDWLKWLLAAAGILILLTLLSILRTRTVNVVSQSRRDDDPVRTVQLGKETVRVEPKPTLPSEPTPTPPTPPSLPVPPKDPAAVIATEPPTPPAPAASPAVVPVADNKVVTIQIPSDVFERVMEKHFPGAGAKLASSVAPATPPSPPQPGLRPPRRDRNRGPKRAARA